jgi:Uma2 family endonuclease
MEAIMTIEEMQRRKKEFGYSNEKLAELSGVPLGTVQKVMSGSTKSPRQGTLEALARALNGQKEVPTRYPGEMIDGCIRVLREPWGAYAAKKEEYTIEDIYALPEGVRAELIDGEIYYMATPTRTHQKIVGEMYLAVAGFVRSHGGACEVYIPPYAVYLNADNSTYLEPDLTVICDLAKSEDKGCVGAPDWVVEVVSPSSKRMDYLLKLFKYRTAGVREYWIINPEKRVVSVYSWNDGYESVEMYSFTDEIPSGIYPDLKIRLADVV